MASNPKIILFLKRQSLIVVTQNGKLATCDLKDDVYLDLEILNHGNFVKVIADFFKKLGIKKTEAALVFAKEVIFEKYVATTDASTQNTEKDFFSSVPFEDRLLAKKVIHDPKGVRLIAVNGDLIRTIVLALTPLEIKFSTVLPATLYKISGDGNMVGVADAQMILGNKLLMEAGNFLELKKKDAKKPNDEMKMDDESADTDGKPRFNQKILLVLGVLLIVGALVIVLFGLGIIKNPFAKPEAKKSTAKTQQVAASPKTSPKNIAAEPKEATTEATPSGHEATKSGNLTP